MADLAQRCHRAGAAWQAGVAAEVERIGGALPGPAERPRAHTQPLTAPRDDGETLPVEAESRISQTPRAAGNAAGHPAPGTGADADRARRAAPWEAERKRMAAVRVVRPWIGPACFLAAALPFVVAPLGWGWGAGRAAGFFLLRPAGTLGVALAILGATAAALLTHRRNTLDGLLACASGALIAGVAGFAVARALVGL